MRGEVYDARLDPVEGSEQRGSRPVVLVRRDAINESSPIVSATPCHENRTRGKCVGSENADQGGDPKPSGVTSDSEGSTATDGFRLPRCTRRSSWLRVSAPHPLAFQ